MTKGRSRSNDEHRSVASAVNAVRPGTQCSYRDVGLLPPLL